MNIKKIALLGVSALVLFGFSGCSDKIYVKMEELNEAVVKINNAPGVPSEGANEKEAAKDLLGSAAVTTIENGYKFFAFKKPSDISNFKGNLMNTPEEFLEHCEGSGGAARIFSIGGGKCGTDNTIAIAQIVMYNEQPTNVIVYDANYILEYYKKNDLLDYEEIEYKHRLFRSDIKRLRR